MKTLNCILLIDDNVDDNFFHSRTINGIKAAKQIQTAIDGEKALEYLEKAKKHPDQYPVPRLIFLDIKMPGMNGFEFLQKAREEQLINAGSPIIIIMLTSSLNPDDEKMAKEKFLNEIKEFRNKPLTEEMLKEILEKYF